MAAGVEVVQGEDGRWRWVVLVGAYRTAPTTDAYESPELAERAATRLDLSVTPTPAPRAVPT